MEAIPERRQTSRLGTKSSNSIRGMLSTLLPILGVYALLLCVFLAFRRKLRGVYGPHTHGRTFVQEQAGTVFGWVRALAKTPNTRLLERDAIDDYLFLRFLKLLIVIALCGCVLTWPILIPINVNGGGREEQFDMLAITNVRRKPLYFSHCLVAGVFYGFVMVAIARESLFYVRLREAYLTSLRVTSRISSRTVLFVDVPAALRFEAPLYRLMPRARQIWIATDVGRLADLVSKRDRMALKLENAEVTLMHAANARRRHCLRHMGDSRPALAANVILWADEKRRPRHRASLFGRRVDTISWCREQLPQLVRDTDALQRSHRLTSVPRLSAVFVEFEDLQSAESAFQELPFHRPRVFTAEAIGLKPDEVIWGNVCTPWWQRGLRNLLANVVVCVAIVFWAPVTAFAGVLSNIDYLDDVEFLRWLQGVSPVARGALTGLAPTIIVTAVVSLVPLFFGYLAELSGATSTREVQLRLQNWSFAFQVVQVFLLVTIGSSATAVFSRVQAHPAIAASILSSNLPKASNFYINYFVYQGVTISSTTVLDILGVFVFAVAPYFVDRTPRQRYNRAMRVQSVSWGAVYPPVTMLAVILLTYAVIAPLMLGFAAVAIALVYAAFRYRFFFPADSGSPGTLGRSYVLALQHLTVGVYLGELCLIGLFAVGSATDILSIGPVVLMSSFSIVTIFFHVSVRSALRPHVTRLPKDLLLTAREADDAPRPLRRATAFRDDRPVPAGSRAIRWIKSLAAAVSVPSLPASFSERSDDYKDVERKEAYLHRAITSAVPHLWFPDDDNGMCSRESALTGRVVGVSNAGAGWDVQTGKLWTVAGDVFGGQEDIRRSPIYQDRIVY